jgi:hypothetical protein
MKTNFLALSVVAFVACTTPSSASSPVPLKGKPTAPVAVTAELSPKSAHVVVKFESDAKDVEIAASGVDGLVVDGKSPVLEKGVFARGDTHVFDVAFVPGAGRSQLVVSVSGSFNGASRARVASFTVGTGPLPQTPGTVMTTDDGERVKVMPASTP